MPESKAAFLQGRAARLLSHGARMGWGVPFPSLGGFNFKNSNHGTQAKKLDDREMDVGWGEEKYIRRCSHIRLQMSYFSPDESLAVFPVLLASLRRVCDICSMYKCTHTYTYIKYMYF